MFFFSQSVGSKELELIGATQEDQKKSRKDVRKLSTKSILKTTRIEYSVFRDIVWVLKQESN